MSYLNFKAKLLCSGIIFWLSLNCAHSQLLGTEKVLVMLVTFQDTPSSFHRFSQAYAHQYIFGEHSGGLNHFLRENSFEKYSIYGDVANWETLHFNRPKNNSEFFTITNAAIARAETQLGVIRSDYKRFIVLGDLPTTFAYTNYAHARTMSGDHPIPATIIHEFGHAIGLRHAFRLDCGVGVVIKRFGCIPREYEDYADIMGGRYGHFKAETKLALGWIEPHEIQEITNSGRYTLFPYASASSSIKALKLNRGSGSGLEPIYIEYRQPIGFDSELALMRNQTGAFINPRLYDGPIMRLRSSLLDLTPHDGDWIRSALYDGSTFIDPATGTSIKVHSNFQDTINPHNSKLELDVKIGKTKLTGPEIEILSPLPGEKFQTSIPIKIKTSDTTGVSNFLVQFNNADVTQHLTLSSEGVYEGLIPVDSLFPGVYTLMIQASDNACSGIAHCDGNNDSFAAQNVEFLGLIGKDYYPPQIEILSPNSDDELTGIMTFSLKATDNVRVTRVELYVHGELRSHSTTAPFSIKLDTRLFSNGFYGIMIKAWDAAGNMGMAMAHYQFNNPMDTTPPSRASITSTKTRSGLSGTVLIKSTATDNIGISQIDLLVNNNIVASKRVAPFNFELDTTMFENGLYKIAIRAWDANHNSRLSSSLTVAIANPKDITPPNLTITSPIDGAISTTKTTISTLVSDTFGINRVEFWVDGVKKKTDTTSPYNYILPLDGISGERHIQVKAYDFFGNITVKEINLMRP
jgi:hypothetical protein